MPCSQCKDLPDELHCIQKIYVKKKTLDKKYIGCGVSMAPPQNVNAIPVSVKLIFIVYLSSKIIYIALLLLSTTILAKQILKKCTFR